MRSAALLVCYNGHTFGLSCKDKLAFDPALNSRAFDYTEASPEAVIKFLAETWEANAQWSVFSRGATLICKRRRGAMNLRSRCAPAA
jgi:hypothetical protein